MNKDYKILKKNYGEKFAQMCRKLFPTILETEGLLSNIILSLFAPSCYLYNDIINQNLIEDFKEYIYNYMDFEKKEVIVDKTVKELFNDAGYNFYECNTERDIQSFKKYYKKEERLCTFRGGRLKRCYVFWAIKKDVDQIKREDFPNPDREDEYGTSVISIQFSRKGNILSIKNRYNHHVNNPDATFSNNLENIIPGLTHAFEKEYGLQINQKELKNIRLSDYTLADDGRNHKYNYELNNIYYCPKNIIIDNGKIKTFDKSRYIIIDYFIVDLKEKTIKLYDESLIDSFVDDLKKIDKIEISKKDKNKIITIKIKNKEDITIVTNNYNRITSIDDKNIKEVGNNYLVYSSHLSKVNLPNLEKVGESFLAWNRGLTKIEFPNLTKTEDNFISANTKINDVSLPNLKETGHYFLMFNKSLTKLSLPKLESTGKGFLCDNIILEQLNAPKLKIVADNFLYNNKELSELDLPELETIKYCFLYTHKKNINLNLPKVKEIDSYFLPLNEEIISINLPNIESIGNFFLYKNNKIKRINMPKLKNIGSCFLFANIELETLSLPQLEQTGINCLYYNKRINTINLPNIKVIGDFFLHNNEYFSSLQINKEKNNKHNNNSILKRLFRKK
ncbi:MAG: hypothetical protein VZS44_02920 [Bacilli bacterium]|nr:hypothetical protein [Bacilli bacterium]